MSPEALSGKDLSAHLAALLGAAPFEKAIDADPEMPDFVEMSVENYERLLEELDPKTLHKREMAARKLRRSERVTSNSWGTWDASNYARGFLKAPRHTRVPRWYRSKYHGALLANIRRTHA